MKKTIFSLILLAALTINGNAQVSVDAGYTSDFTIAGTARAEDSAYLGITGIKEIKAGLHAYAFNYFVPGNGWSGTKDGALDASQNHAGAGLAKKVDSVAGKALGAFAFTADAQAVYHLVNGPLGDSFQYSLGLTFDSLPVLGQVADLSVTYMNDVDLAMDGFQFELSRSYSVIENVSVTPKVGAVFLDDNESLYAGAKVSYDKYGIKPYVGVRYMDNDFGGILAVEDDVQWSLGAKYSF
jgi:hypothetical protein